MVGLDDGSQPAAVRVKSRVPAARALPKRCYSYNLIKFSHLFNVNPNGPEGDTFGGQVVDECLHSRWPVTAAAWAHEGINVNAEISSQSQRRCAAQIGVQSVSSLPTLQACSVKHLVNEKDYKPQLQQTGSHLSSSRPNCLRRLFLRFLSLHRDQKHPNIARSQPIRTPSTTGPPALASSSLCEINKKTEVGCVRK